MKNDKNITEAHIGDKIKIGRMKGDIFIGDKLFKISDKELTTSALETIEKSVSKGKKVTLVGFGTFEPRKRAAREGRNPQTGAKLKIAAKTVPAFSAGKRFKELVK